MIMIAIIMSMTLQVHLRRLPRPEGLNCRALGFSLSKCYLAPCVTSRHLMDILMSKMMVILVILVMMIMVVILVMLVMMIMMTPWW